MQIPKENLFCLQDEADSPYNEGECPRPFTKEDEVFFRNLAHKHGLLFKDEEENSSNADESYDINKRDL